MSETRQPVGIDGPHSDDTTIGTAEAFAEAVRVLNHAAIRSAGLTYPATVHRVLAELASGTHRLDQLASQLGKFLGRELAAGRLGDDCGADPAGPVNTACHHLAMAANSAAYLAAELSQAQQAIATLHHKRPRDE
jgi:hypothetical protein